MCMTKIEWNKNLLTKWNVVTIARSTYYNFVLSFVNKNIFNTFKFSHFITVTGAFVYVKSFWFWLKSMTRVITTLHTQKP